MVNITATTTMMAATPITTRTAASSRWAGEDLKRGTSRRCIRTGRCRWRCAFAARGCGGGGTRSSEAEGVEPVQFEGSCQRGRGLLQGEDVDLQNLIFVLGTNMSTRRIGHMNVSECYRVLV